MGGVKVEPTGWRAEVERKDKRPEAEPQDPLARLVIARPAASCHSKAFLGKTKGCSNPAEVVLKD